MGSRILEGLNPGQARAVKTTEGYVRVLAGPGTGKTLALTARCAYLITMLGISPRSVLCVTFTNKAAAEMRSRIQALCGGRVEPFVATFHGFCAQFLREEAKHLGFPANFALADVEEVKEMLKPIYRTLNINGRDLSLQDEWNYIDLVKSTRLSYVHELLSEDSGDLLREAQTQDDPKDRIFYAYLYAQRSTATLDFDDLIAFTLEILHTNKEVRDKWQSRLEYILVDEFQDIDKLQYELTEILAGGHHNLFIVGDPDQTIYSFRGADVKLFTDFPQLHQGCAQIAFEENYRSQGAILDCAYTLISNNPDPGRVHLKARRTDISEKNFAQILPPLKKVPRESEVLDAVRVIAQQGKLGLEVPQKDDGGERALLTPLPAVVHSGSEILEAEYIAREIGLIRQKAGHASVAVLYRAHHVSREVERALLRRRIPYRIMSGTGFFSRAEVRDVMAYVRLCLNPADDRALRRVINEPRRGFGARRLEKLARRAREKGCSLYEALKDSFDDQALLRGTTVRLFAETLQSLHAYIAKLKPTAALEQVLNAFGYEEYLKDSGQKERLESLATLRSLAKDFETSAGESTSAADFVTDLALYQSADLNAPRDAVRLMTVHNSKGLEFDYVFVAGVNEKLFPSAKSETEGELEEERRLMYVAMTRAAVQLFITTSMAFGQSDQENTRKPSRFIEELDPSQIAEMGGSFARRGLVSGGSGAAQFKPGDRVFHEIFGPGTVKEVRQSAGEYVIDFPALKSPRTLSFQAPLERLDGQGSAVSVDCGSVQ